MSSRIRPAGVWNSSKASMSNCRGRGTSTAMISATRPGRGDITTTRSASITASGIEWVTNSIVLGCSRQMRISSSVSSSRVSASSAPNGSSISRMSGSCTSARQMPTRCCMPPDSSRGIFALEAHEPDQLEEALARSELSGRNRFIMLERKQHVVEHARPRQQRRRLEDDAGLGARLAHRLAVDRDAARGRRDEAGDEPQQRRLAAARRPDEADELVAADRERDVGQRCHAITSRETKMLRHVLDLDHERGGSFLRPARCRSPACSPSPARAPAPRRWPSR